jgi:transcription elongation GreA/GreB family factor
MTEAERDRYRRFLAAAEEKLARDRQHLTKLRARWQHSGAIADGVTPRGVATLYSQVRIRDMKSGRTHVQTVVLPTDAEVRADRRALSSWPGPMLLGAREGDEIQWASEAVLQQLRLEEVLHQPQTALSAFPAQTPRAVRAAPPAVTDMTRLSLPRNEKSRWAHSP